MIEKLIGLLNEIDASSLEDSLDDYLASVCGEKYKKLIEDARNEATDSLIDRNGQNIWEAHDILKKNGFYVFCGERDRFGWLSGCIQTKKGILVYG